MVRDSQVQVTTAVAIRTTMLGQILWIRAHQARPIAEVEVEEGHLKMVCRIALVVIINLLLDKEAFHFLTRCTLWVSSLASQEQQPPKRF
jgi:hypothetical protein